ncbi:MAG: type II toxin-antitoxin system mRNA interferase toxin, RelE/StbE family [Patescibacteria group bacterium]
MFVKRIFHHDDFLKDFCELSWDVQKRTVKIGKLFRENPLHPSLRLHQLHGSLMGIWSISVTEKIRILFQREESGDIVFLSIGHHDIYKNL